MALFSWSIYCSFCFIYFSFFLFFAFVCKLNSFLHTAMKITTHELGHNHWEGVYSFIFLLYTRKG
uniref:Uncharacterized protein n=1 Tax=Octopus bimaculoides TaxID=37653 RepID=A0A0L8G6X9_OCTBM